MRHPLRTTLMSLAIVAGLLTAGLALGDYPVVAHTGTTVRALPTPAAPAPKGFEGAVGTREAPVVLPTVEVTASIHDVEG